MIISHNEFSTSAKLILQADIRFENATIKSMKRLHKCYTFDDVNALNKLPFSNILLGGFWQLFLCYVTSFILLIANAI